MRLIQREASLGTAARSVYHIRRECATVTSRGGIPAEGGTTGAGKTFDAVLAELAQPLDPEAVEFKAGATFAMTALTVKKGIRRG